MTHLKAFSLALLLLSACSTGKTECTPGYRPVPSDAGDGAAFKADPDAGISDAECERACTDIGPCILNARSDKEYEIWCKQPILQCGS